MSQPNNTHHPRLEPALAELLRALRGRIRRYVSLEGAAWAVAWLGVAFWLSLLVDWWLEPPVPLRAMVLALAGAGLLYVVGRYLVGRLLVRMNDSSMALLLERRYRQFQESLVTAVELGRRDAAADGYNPELLAETSHTALRRAAGVEIAGVLNPRPLRKALLAASLLIVSVLIYGGLAPRAFGIWARRTFAFSSELWPRRVELFVDGFDSRRIKVARGDDVKLIVKARADKEIPRYVQIYYRAEDGDRGQPRMIRDGVAPLGAAFQDYSYTFASVRSSIDFDVYGGDDAVQGLRIEVVESPAIRSLAVHCQFPEYTRRVAVDLPVTSSIELSQGSRVTVRAEANKDLTAARIDYPLEGGSPVVAAVSFRDGSRRRFEYTVDQLDADRSLTFTLTDTDGIANREPIRLTLLAVPDQKPALAVQLQGIGTAITPQARIPIAGQITDDYGIHAAWFEYTIDDGQLATRDFATAPADRLELAADEALEVGGLELRPGQKLLVGVSAKDNRGLADGPQTADGERYQLDVVSPEDLLMMLVARELSLRQRFEAIKAELETTRDLVASFSAEPTATVIRRATVAVGSGLNESASFVAQVAPVPPNDEEPAAAEDRLAASRALQVERALQNSRKEAQETLGVAAAFDQIRAELINNRVDNEELRSRLKEGIADPVRRIGDAMYPEMERRLEALKSSLDNPAAAEAAQGEAIAQMNAIVAEMERILDRMRKLENFNELVARLRKIVDLQKEMVELTRRRRTEKLRSLNE
jgi:hypothetical protein